MSPLVPSLVELLESCQQAVEPNVKALAEEVISLRVAPEVDPTLGEETLDEDQNEQEDEFDEENEASDEE